MSQLICEEIILDCALVDIWDRGYSKIDLDHFLINIEYELYLYLKDWKIDKIILKNRQLYQQKWLCLGNHCLLCSMSKILRVKVCMGYQNNVCRRSMILYSHRIISRIDAKHEREWINVLSCAPTPTSYSLLQDQDDELWGCEFSFC